MSGSQSTLRAIERVATLFDVLERFAAGDQAEAPTLSAISRRAGVPLTTTHRMLGAMVRCRLVERSDNLYYLGARLFELGSRVRGRVAFREVARPYMQDLFEVTRQTVHLGVLDGVEVLYIEKFSGHRPADSPSRIGGRIPASCTAIGKSMLAFDPEASRRLARVGRLEAMTPHSITDAGRLADELVEIRRLGFAADHEEAALGLSCVAAPIRRHGRAVGAVSVSGGTDGFAVDRLAPVVRATALVIERQHNSLGERGEAASDAPEPASAE